LLRQHTDPKLQAFIIWEPVIATDIRAPSSRTLARIGDKRVRQYWDRDRLLSRAMGEKDRSTIVWDVINLYDAQASWGERPPAPVFSDRPVVRVIDRAAAALAERTKG
jgi:hypothetical protein